MKQKLTPEEKAEIRREKKSWKWLIRMARRRNALIEETLLTNILKN